VIRPGRKDARNFLNELQAGSEVIDLDDPSAVLITDPETGTKTISGPYPNGYAAFDGMEFLRTRGGLPPDCVLEVVPCYPPPPEVS
jgi:hypothetical protein